MHQLCDKSRSIRAGFTSLINTLQKSSDDERVDQDKTVREEINTEISEASARIEEELQRFDLWARTLGAYLRTHASLDYRLREAPSVQSLTTWLLNDLDVNVRLTHELIEAAKDRVFPISGTDDSSSEEEETTWHESESFLAVFLGSISSTIDRLYRISFHLRNPSTRGDSSKAKSFKDIDPETGIDVFDSYAEYDRKNIFAVLLSLRRSKIADSTDNTSLESDAGSVNLSPGDVQAQLETTKEKGSTQPFENNYLAERLWQANVLRRRQFGYWRRQREKRGAAAEESTTNTTTDEDNDGEQKAVEEATSPPTVSGPSKATTFVGKDVNIDDTETQISSATYAIVQNERNGDELVFPAVPSELKEKREFQCPYCQDVFPASLSKRSAWETHILRDLRPYVCTFDRCQQSDQLFTSMQTWIRHEASAHNLGLDQYVSPELPSALLSDLAGRDCPICLRPDVTSAHIALHLQRIALFSLPRPETHKEDEDVDSNALAGVAVASISVAISESISDDEALSSQTDSAVCCQCGSHRETRDLVFCDKCNEFFCASPSATDVDTIVGGDANAQSCWQKHQASGISHKPYEASFPLRELDHIPGIAKVQKAGLLLDYLEESGTLTSLKPDYDNSSIYEYVADLTVGNTRGSNVSRAPTDGESQSASRNDQSDEAHEEGAAKYALHRGYLLPVAGEQAASADASDASNSAAFSQMLEQYNNLKEQTMYENMEMQKAQAFWNPLESMSKRDATS